MKIFGILEIILGVVLMLTSASDIQFIPGLIILLMGIENLIKGFIK